MDVVYSVLLFVEHGHTNEHKNDEKIADDVDAAANSEQALTPTSTRDCVD